MSLRHRRYANAAELWAKKTKLGQINEMFGMQVFSSDRERCTRIPFVNNVLRDWTRSRQYAPGGNHGIYDYDEGSHLYYRREWAEKTFNLTFDLIKNYVSKEDRILDCCCGSGWQMDQLYKRGYTNVIGIDADANQVAYAKEKRPHLEIVAGFFGPQKNDISCDVMLWFGSISRIPYHFRLFDAIERCARKFVVINSQEVLTDCYRDPHYNLAKKGFMLLEKRTITEDDKNVSGNDDFKPFGTLGMDRPFVQFTKNGHHKRLFRSVCLFMRV